MSSRNSSSTSLVARARPKQRRASSSHHTRDRRRRSQSGTYPTAFGNVSSLDGALGSIRLLVLARLSEIEDLLSQAEVAGVSDVVDASCMLEKLREEVLQRLPAVSLDTSALEDALVQHLPWTASDIRTQLESLRTRLPEFSLADMPMPAWAADIADDWKRVVSTVRSKLADLETSLQNLSFAPTPSASASSASSMPMRRPSAIVSEFLDRIAASDIFDEYRETEESNRREKEMAVATETEVARALEASCNGERHISYHQLPFMNKNNEYVHEHYRFIPLSKWPKLLLSAFTFHNEFLSIHTHLLPLVVSFGSCYVLGPDTTYFGTPDMLYVQFARLCLLTSAIWHIFAGCGHAETNEFFARLDYVGIGWLISASIATVVYYSWSCHPAVMYPYLGACLVSAVSGSFLPFMTWFNERKHKKWRLLYFVGLGGTGFAPMVHLALTSSWRTVLHFVSPLFPSLASYLIGVAFYATHFPECMYRTSGDAGRARSKRSLMWADRMDHIGLNSHAIWHLFILGGIWLHRRCVQYMSAGFGDDPCPGVIG